MDCVFRAEMNAAQTPLASITKLDLVCHAYISGRANLSANIAPYAIIIYNIALRLRTLHDKFLSAIDDGRRHSPH
jgi:hypothetical protein